MNILNITDLMTLTGWSKQHIYKLTSNNAIPFYKPFGKTLFFKKDEIEKWLLQNRQKPRLEIEEDVIDYIQSKRRIA